MNELSKTAPGENPALSASIDLPYDLTVGRATGRFLAELANRRIVGSRCDSCERVLVPAQDFCSRCGTANSSFVEVPEVGTVSGFTRTHAGTLGLIRLDGADTDLVHRLLDVELEDLSIGQRVRASWADEPEGQMLDLSGFELADGAEQGQLSEYTADTDPIEEQPYELHLDYQHAYGPFYGRLFDELATSRRILGVRCPECRRVLLPPREYCDECYVPTDIWVDLPDTGELKAFSVIHLEFVGQKYDPPYVYAEIVLDGASTRLIHVIGGIDVEKAPELLSPGMRVRAVWRDDVRVGTLEDITHFEPITEDAV